MQVSNNQKIFINNGEETKRTTSPQKHVVSAFIPQCPPLKSYPSKDIFAAQTKPLTTSLPEKIASNTLDKIYLKALPEKFIAKYANNDFLTKAISNNPQIEKMLKEEGLNVRIEPQNVTTIANSHLIPTMKYAKNIMLNSGEYFSPKEYELMAQAALIHDLGKALIPSEILNKKGALSPKEKEIVKLHNDIGYELLKSTNLSPRVLSMVQNHHGYGNIYPKDSLTQILTIADVYSALKEKRAYKKVMNDEEAFKILEQGANAGDFNINYVTSLKKSLQNKNI